MLLDNVAGLCVPMGTCKILPPQLYKVEILTKSFDFFYVCSARALSNEYKISGSPDKPLFFI